MTTNADIVNRALQTFGSRTTVTAAELANQTSNEAIQANLILTNYRDDLLRMAPWDCGMNTANLVYITSQPGTPENSSPATNLWQKGQPAPPWLYEYQYPVDCLKACWIVPQLQLGLTGTPITTAVTGFSPYYNQGPAIKFKVGIDQFRPVTGVVVAIGGANYAVGDYITLNNYASTTGPAAVPAGAGPVVQVVTAPGGVVGTIAIISQIPDTTPPLGGSLFASFPNGVGNTIAQASTTGLGTGATFNITAVQNPAVDQRVILTNQEFATLSYVRRVTDPNVMDTLFQSAWISLLGAGLVMALTGDKTLANMRIQEANNDIIEARKADGNEGLTIIDGTPDWIRARGFISPNQYGWNGQGFDWGGLWPTY